MQTSRPFVWIVDSAREPLAACLDAFSEWADARYAASVHDIPDWNEEPPDAVFVSAEVDGGPDGPAFAALVEQAAGVPLVAVSAVRSLAQAVAFFRAGAMDYLSIPLDSADTRERCQAAIARAEATALSSVMVELEAVDDDPGEVELHVAPSEPAPESVNEPAPEPEDILAEIPIPVTEALPVDESGDDDDEPVAVDGLPIPTLWEELPCGLVVFDSDGNLAFSNQLGLDMFGADSMGGLQTALESDRARFNAYTAGHKPLADNQWPHALARKTKTARSAVISVEISEKRRSWLRLDCLPHLADGQLTRLTMSVINLTGELPPLAPVEAVPAVKKTKAKKRGKRTRT